MFSNVFSTNVIKMIFGSVIRSKNKKNLEFAAMGSFQIEFFSLENHNYFVIYKFYGNNSGWIELKFSDISVEEPVKNRFKIKKGKSDIIIRLEPLKNGQKMVFQQRLWGWLLIRNYTGRISELGWNIVLKHLKCKELVVAAENMGFAQADVQVSANKRQLISGIRNNERVNYESSVMAESLWDRLKALSLPDSSGKAAIGLSPFFRFYTHSV